MSFNDKHSSFIWCIIVIAFDDEFGCFCFKSRMENNGSEDRWGQDTEKVSITEMELELETKFVTFIGFAVPPNNVGQLNEVWKA